MYQKHSETSRQAYKTLEGAKEAAERIYKAIEAAGLNGISAPQIAAALDMVPGTVAARVIGLERDRRIVKLERTEKSPSGRAANVIIAMHWKPSALARGERILLTKPEDSSAGVVDSETREILKEVANLVALGTPILYGSPLHKKIERVLNNG